ncbi:MAG: carbon-nitrogen hydrolase family protein [Bacteroidota bacterium]
MKICLAQTQSQKGNIQENIRNHLRFVDSAIDANADLIVFPELSITGYEPELAEALAVNINDEIFNPFQYFADRNDIVIGVGMPTRATNGIHISMIIFQPQKGRAVYSKHLLHEDELPYFVPAPQQAIFKIKGKRIGLGICYETLQRSHFEHAVENGADLYVASVAKPDRGVSKAYLHFPTTAMEFGIPVLMVNCVGYCDNFLSNGKSSVWNSKGVLLGQLNDNLQGYMVYDTELGLSNSKSF